MNDIEKAKNFLRNDVTCAVSHGDRIMTSLTIGISPILDWIDGGYDLKGWSAADRVVGRAAALLMVYAGIIEVYADVMSRGAVQIFNEYGIKYSYNTLTDVILNRTQTDWCPMELAVQNLDQPSAALDAIRTRRDTLRKQAK